MAAGVARRLGPEAEPTDQPDQAGGPLEIEPGDDDLALVVAARTDPAAFAPLYCRYVLPIYRYCYRRLGSHEAAEDATSQVFVKALAGLGGFVDGSFRAWLFTVADRVVTDLYRRRRPGVELDQAADLVDLAPGPEDLALTGETRRTVQALLTRLPPDQRRIVELRLAGLTGPEIARVLGRRPEAIKSAQFRAYARLRRLLTEDAAEGSSDVGR